MFHLVSWCHHPKFCPLIPKLCSVKSEHYFQCILVSHWLKTLLKLTISQWETRNIGQIVGWWHWETSWNIFWSKHIQKRPVSYSLSLWNHFENEKWPMGIYINSKTCFISSPEIKFIITGELTAPWVIFTSDRMLRSHFLYVCMSVRHTYQIIRTELDWIVNMDQILNYADFENFTNTEYRIIQFLKMNEYRISNNTIRSQLFEYRILNIE